MLSLLLVQFYCFHFFFMWVMDIVNPFLEMRSVCSKDFVKSLLGFIFFNLTLEFTVYFPGSTIFLNCGSPRWLNMSMTNELFYRYISNEKVKAHHVTSRSWRYRPYWRLWLLLSFLKVVGAVSFLTWWEIFLGRLGFSETKCAIRANEIWIYVHFRLLFWHSFFDILGRSTVMSLRNKWLGVLLRNWALGSLYRSTMTNCFPLLLFFYSPSLLQYSIDSVDKSGLIVLESQVNHILIKAFLFKVYPLSN